MPPPPYKPITDERLAQAVEQLSPELRKSFLMNGAGHSYKEIGHALGISLVTVARRLHEARQQLRERLNPEPTDPPGAPMSGPREYVERVVVGKLASGAAGVFRDHLPDDEKASTV